jgi:predicted transcriptional regulator
MKKLLAVRIEDRTIQKLHEIGRKQDRSVSYLIRKAVEEFVKSHEGAK